MAYTRVNWVDNTTPVDQAHLNVMDAGIAANDTALALKADSAAMTAALALKADATAVATADALKVDKDSVVIAASRIVASKLLAGDAQPAFRVLGDGSHAWGPGGATAPDTTLYRSAAGDLKTDGRLLVGGNIALKNGATQQLYMGDVIGGGQAGIGFGSAADTTLYRNAANDLRTDGQFSAGADIFARLGAATQVAVGAVAGKAGLFLGNGFDANLYRYAAGTLASDGTFYASVGAAQTGVGAVGPSATPGIQFGPGANYLYLVGPAALRTNCSFHADGGVSLLSGADTVELHGEIVRAGPNIKALKLLINGVAYKIDLKPA